jgi:protein ImuB
LQVTPRVARLEEAWGLDVGHTLRLWGGLPGVLKRLHAEVLASDAFRAGPGTVPELAQGSTALAALARWRAGQRVPLWGEGAGVPDAPPLQHLPLHTLSAAMPHAAVLARLGLRTWGHLRRLPRDGVARRWGSGVLTALDQALGVRPHPHVWLALPPEFDQTCELPHALDSAPALLPHAQRLLEALLAWLRARQRGVLAVRWQWTHDTRRDVPATGGFELRTAQATQALDHLLRLTAEHLARQPLVAPVLALRLSTLAHAPWVAGSADCWQAQPPSDPQPVPWTALLERLSARLGPDALTVWQPHSDHRAEHMQHAGALQEVAEKSIQTSGGGTFCSEKKSGQTWPAVSGSLWPTWLLSPPQPLAVRGHRPCFQGELQLLAGPQRLELTQWPGAGVSVAPDVADGEWATVRDYFVARSPRVGLLWVYRVPPGARWFLHGLYA